MKRATKNIISFTLLILFIVALCLSVNHMTGKQGSNPQPALIQQTRSQDRPPAKPDDNGQNIQGPPEQNGASGPSDTAQHIMIAVLSILISAILIYLLMSGLNKRNFRSTFRNRDKITIYILAVILLSGVIFTGTNTMAKHTGTSGDVKYSAVKEITDDTQLDNEDLSSSEKNQNVILADGDIDVSLSGMHINKSGDSDGGDNSSFYGNNSCILAKSGAQLTMSGMDISTESTGANGVFSYGNSNISIKDSKITSTGDSSGGIMVAGGGNIYARNLDIQTSGTSSAAVRSDRGGGNIYVEKGSYTTTGAGSPAVYSTADIVLSDAKLTSKASEGIVIEGKNSVTLNSCTLTDNNTVLNGLSTTYKNIFLYQSMSGDADTGTAAFTAKDSTITTQKGDTFYITNTSAEISLENNEISNTGSEGNFLRVQKDSWGNEGTNGGNVKLSMIKQTASGNISVDSLSTLDMDMKSGSTYEGAINSANTAKSLTLTLDKSSTIILTGDCYLTELNDEDADYGNIDFNGHKLYVNGVAIN